MTPSTATVYNISDASHNLIASIDARTPERAASQFCRECYPHHRTIYARRTTGDHGKTGYFRCYHHVRGTADTSTSAGEPFHVF